MKTVGYSNGLTVIYFTCYIRAVDKREYLMIIFLFLIEIIYCDPSSEPSRRDGSDEGLQHMFLWRINKNYP